MMAGRQPLPLAGDGPRILHLIPADGIGGVEVAAKSMLARSDLPCRFRLQFIEPSAPGKRTFAGAARALAAHRRAVRPARAFDPDVILCSLWRSVPLALLLRVLLPRAKLVYFVHAESTAHRLDTTMSRLAMWRADAVWGDSSAALVARGAPVDRSRAISFVTERVAMTDKPFVGPRFVSWGRLNRLKGFDRAIRFVAMLVERGVDARYDIHGPDDGEGDALLVLIDGLGLRDRVRLMGAAARGELAGIADRNAFFLQPSRSEGMCMAVVEAMQRGLVPVTTAVGEMAHYVVPGDTGVIVDPERMDGAVEAVAALIADPGEWRQRSVAAMRRWHGAPLYAEDICRAASELIRHS